MHGGIAIVDMPFQVSLRHLDSQDQTAASLFQLGPGPCTTHTCRQLAGMCGLTEAADAEYYAHISIQVHSAIHDKPLCSCFGGGVVDGGGGVVRGKGCKMKRKGSAMAGSSRRGGSVLSCSC
jgi:hypothetical protein